jgi:hypothetical protein
VHQQIWLTTLTDLSLLIHCQRTNTITMTILPAKDSKSQLFSPTTIGNGRVQLAHRVVLAPLTRNRGTPLKEDSTAEDPNRIWLPNDLMAEYYAQRASKGGLMITEGVPPSLEVSGFTFLNPAILRNPSCSLAWEERVLWVSVRGRSYRFCSFRGDVPMPRRTTKLQWLRASDYYCNNKHAFTAFECT